jgi:hypothetical protein
MISFPERCKVNKFIPKKTFYEKIGLSTAVKDGFVNYIEKIIWLYKLSEETIGITKTEKTEEIQVFELTLKSKIIPKNIIRIITKSIPYKILFVLKFENEFCYAIRVAEDIYFTEWNEEITMNLVGLNLDDIYKDIVKSIIKEQDNDKEFEDIIDKKNKVDELYKKIEQLKNKINNEKQFNKKVELNLELQKLNKEMKELIYE